MTWFAEEYWFDRESDLLKFFRPQYRPMSEKCATCGAWYSLEVMKTHKRIAKHKTYLS